MNTTEQFTIGGTVVCCDGGDGELRRVVVDPVARSRRILPSAAHVGREPTGWSR